MYVGNSSSVAQLGDKDKEFFWCDWDLNLGLCACKAGILPLEPCLWSKDKQFYIWRHMLCSTEEGTVKLEIKELNNFLTYFLP
jgi:hypothetical protein